MGRVAADGATTAREERELLLYSLNCFRSLLFPLLEAAEIDRLCEIGVERGLFTRELIGWCREHGIVYTGIDPSLERSFSAPLRGKGVRFFRKPSLEQLPKLTPQDVYLIDGDHNYYTVFHELKAIFKDHPGAPLILFHDVCWPWARRDLYYEPDRIPKRHRRAHTADKGPYPGQKELDPDGFAGASSSICHYSAIKEGGPRNGVLTAIEDFQAKHLDDDWRLLIVPAVFGLGILYRPAALSPTLADHLAKLETSLAQTGDLLGLLEENRLHLLFAYLKGARYLNYLETQLDDQTDRKLAVRKQQNAFDALLAENEKLQAALAEGREGWQALFAQYQQLQAFAQKQKETVEALRAEKTQRKEQQEAKNEAYRALQEHSEALGKSFRALQTEFGKLQQENEKVRASWQQLRDELVASRQQTAARTHERDQLRKEHDALVEHHAQLRGAYDELGQHARDLLAENEKTRAAYRELQQGYEQIGDAFTEFRQAYGALQHRERALAEELQQTRSRLDASEAHREKTRVHAEAVRNEYERLRAFAQGQLDLQQKISADNQALRTHAGELRNRFVDLLTAYEYLATQRKKGEPPPSAAEIRARLRRLRRDVGLRERLRGSEAYADEMEAHTRALHENWLALHDDDQLRRTAYEQLEASWWQLRAEQERDRQLRADLHAHADKLQSVYLEMRAAWEREQQARQQAVTGQTRAERSFAELYDAYQGLQTHAQALERVNQSQAHRIEELEAALAARKRPETRERAVSCDQDVDG